MPLDRRSLNERENELRGAFFLFSSCFISLHSWIASTWALRRCRCPRIWASTIEWLVLEPECSSSDTWSSKFRAH